MSRFIHFLPLLLLCAVGFSQTPQDVAIPVHVSTGINPPAVLITWANPAPSDVILRRRIKGQAGNTWVDVVNAQSTLLDGYFDLGLSGDESYEYAVERKTGAITAYGYAFANFFTPIVDTRGKILVFIDSTTADQLGADLVTFKNDLRGEGWQTVPFKTGNSTTVQWVKNKIQSAYNADPGNVKAVLLLGTVPIPYAGSQAKDNKADHVGAWPCDAYYGDVNGTWTDNSVNIPGTARPANRNVPGDGKFDQNTLPSAVELPVGRLDFRRLSAATFGATPVELLRKYLLKNHLYRTGQYKVPNRALVDDHLGWSNGEAFASDGYRNAYPLTGPNEVVAGDFLGQTNPQRYLLGYGAGTAGSYSAATGIGTAANVAADTINVVFANLFGDYFGDWDFETNPLMPAVLAAKGGVLACSWSGRPHWMQQGLATGETIGYCLKETQNAQFNSAYGHSNGESGTHIALLGDPTLRAQIVPPVSNLIANSNCNKVNLHWTAAPDSGILGYIVYRSFNLDGPYLRVSQGFVTQNSWDDTAPVADTLFYAVRAMKLEVTPGGGAFYNSSTSPIQSVVFVPGTGPTAFGLGGTITCTHPSLTLGTNFQPPTCTWQWFKPNGQPLGGFTATEPGVYTVVVTAPNGCTVAAYATVNADTYLPVLEVPAVVVLNCNNPSASVQMPPASPGVQYTYNGVVVNGGAVLNLNASAVFSVMSANNGCSEDYPVLVQQDFTPPAIQISNNGLQLDCNHTTVQLTANGTNVAQYAWSGNGQSSNNQTLLVTTPGSYCCTITGANGCTASTCAVVTENGAGFDLFIGYAGGPCVSGEKTLIATIGGGATPFVYNWSNGATSATTTVPAGFSGVVSVTVTDNNGCDTQATISIVPSLTAFALTSKPTSGTSADGSIDLLVTGGQAPFSFAWSNGSTSEDISSLTSGIYTVTVTGANACSTVLTVPLITVGIQEQEINNKLKVDILPNPVQNRMTVRVENPEGTNVVLILRDLSGRLITTQSGHEDLFFFDTTILSAGLYVLWVETSLGGKAFKVVMNDER
jgi:hypothetical protein